MSHLKYTQPATRAYAVFNVKASARDDGTIVGIASTPELDRMGDVLVPTGAKYKLPIPLLWQHDSSKPLGHVTSAKVSSTGIEIIGKIAVGATAEIDNVYKLVQAGLVRGLSVGFRALEQPEVTRTGLLYKSWEMMELSVVTLPCNASATITAVKSACGVASLHGGAVKISYSTVSVPRDSVKLNTGSVRLSKPGVRLVGGR